jgi:hypothetical protein
MTCGELQAFSQEELHERFGKFGAELYERCRGVDERPVQPDRARKSLSNAISIVRHYEFRQAAISLAFRSQSLCRHRHRSRPHGCAASWIGSGDERRRNSQKTRARVPCHCDVWQRRRTPALTALEIDHQLASALTKRLVGTDVRVVEGDAAAMPFEDHSFSTVVSLAMLHHVPSTELQDRLLTKVARTLQP